MKKLLIFCITMLLLSSICNGQGYTPFGATVPNNFSKTLGKMWVTTLGGQDTVIIMANDSGVFKAIPIATFRALVNIDTGFVRYIDTAAMLSPYLRAYDPSRAVTVSTIDAGAVGTGILNTGGQATFDDGVVMTTLPLVEGPIVTYNNGVDDALGYSALSTGDIATTDSLSHIILPRLTGDTLRANGDSWAACVGASVVDSCFVNLLSDQLNIPLVNYALGGTGMRYSALQTYLYKPRDRGLNIINTGPNDTYYAYVNNYSLTTLYNYYGNYLNLYLVGCFEDTVSSVQSSYFTKSGTITTNSKLDSRSVSLGSTVTVLNVAGDYVEFTTADSGIMVHYFKSTRSRYGTLRMTVAGSLVDSLIPQLEAWATDLYSADSIFPTAQYFSLKGYGTGSKTVRLTAVGTATSGWWIDAIGFPKTDANKRGVVMMQPSQSPLSANNPKHAPKMFAVEAAQRNYVSTYWQGFPIRIVAQPLNLQSDFDNDGSHPNNKGHRLLDSAALATINNCINPNVYYGSYTPDIGVSQNNGSVYAYSSGGVPTINIPYSTFTTPGILKFGVKEIPGGATQFGDVVDLLTLTSPGGILYTTSASRVAQTSGFNYIAPSAALGLGDATPDEVLDIERNLNSQTVIKILNNQGGSAASTGIEFEISGTGNVAGLYKRSITAGAIGTAALLGDFMLYNAGTTFLRTDIALVNANPRGRIKFTAGNASAPHMLIDTVGSVGIGTVAPVASAILEISSTTKGFLPPNMTATQGSAISSPANGLMICVTDTNGTFTSVGIWAYIGGAWTKL